MDENRGGWSIGELFGFTKEKEEEIVNKVREVFIANDEIEDGGKSALIDLIEMMKDWPMEEGVIAMLFFGRAIGMAEREEYGH